MAKQYGKNNADFAAANLMSFGKSFSNMNGQPLLKSEAWYDLNALKAFALTDSAYVGQKVFYVDVENSEVIHYSIEIDGSLKELGSATAGDGKSIDLGDGNILSLKNFGKKYYRYNAEAGEGGNPYTLVDDGTFPAGLQPKTRLAEDGTIELAWYEPSSTTVEGLSEQISSLAETVNTMQETVSNNSQSIGNKVDKEAGKVLSSNDYTTDEKEKLSRIPSDAQVNVLEGIQVNGVDQGITNKKVNIYVPTKLSDLSNDKSFIDNTVNNLTNYYTKTESYSKNEVNDLLVGISSLDILVVDELPIENISTTTIYLVSKTDSDTDDVYDEYIYVSSTSTWEMIGNTVINLSNYLQKTGDASNTTVAFTATSNRELPTTGGTLGTIVGKIIKFLTDLKAVAFSGSYNDLTDKPEYKSEYLSGTLTAGNVSVSLNIPEGSIFANIVVKESDGSIVFTDVVVEDNKITISVSETLDTDLSILITYYN